MNRVLLSAIAAAAAIATTSAPSPASVNDLVAFLERAERMYATNRIVQAKVSIEKADGTKDEALIILDPGRGGRQFFALKSSGFRALTPLSWQSAGWAVDGPGKSSRSIGVDEALGGTDLRGIDFFPFWKSDYSSAFVSDQNRNEKTVSLYAQSKRPYKLYVVTFDTTKFVPRVVKYYRDTFNNMVRIRNDEGYVMVGTRPRPTRMTVNDYSENTVSSYSFQWSVLDAAPPGLMAETSFGAAPLNW